ncbi:hypothetical protein RHMOL_Rhmol10G0214200 [Rhododendron molle]|uniref:Uncharacterized protein n=1 Tax=Rhododendron molle TaxID=49168 RepID=A0ACC0M5Z0_RHOML|nr:hypothetical protein RHMOL_Rhmol10G0214200 [Rhododendron molle]
MDSPLDDSACHQFPSTSTSTLKKARKGVGTDEMDEDTITGFENVHNASDMPLYTPEHMMDDVVHTSIMGNCGSHTGAPIDQHKLNMDEEVKMQQEVVLEMQGKVDGEGEQVQVQVQVDEGVIEERALTRPSKKRGSRTVKACKATRTPYVAEPVVKDSKIQQEVVLEMIDCGFYTLRFMEHWTGGMMNTCELEANMGIDMRKRLLVWFILSPHNNSRDDVQQKCR